MATSSLPRSTPASSQNKALLRLTCAAIFVAGYLVGCAHVAHEPSGYHEQGLASWYGAKFQGKKTASGERFDMHALTAAHRSLPLGTKVEVRSLSTGKTVVVRINDRGPQDRSRILDLSYAAAAALGIVASGTARVEVAQFSSDKN